MPSTDFNGAPVLILGAKNVESIINYIPSSIARSRMVRFLNEKEVRKYLQMEKEPEYED